VRIHSAITCFLLLNVTLAYAQPLAQSTSEGVFTEEQAQRGAMATIKIVPAATGALCEVPIERFLT
jgi:hypothetical protein